MSARRFERNLSVVMLDIDHFKKVNDKNGHATGDQVLREVAQRCTNIIREIDLFARYGGEEFTIVLPETDLGETQAVAERIRQLIGEKPFEIGKLNLEITISLGVASLIPEDINIDALIKRADEAL